MHFVEYMRMFIFTRVCLCYGINITCHRVVLYGNKGKDAETATKGPDAT